MAEALAARSALAGVLRPGRFGPRAGPAGVVLREAAVDGCAHVATRAGVAMPVSWPERPGWRDVDGLRVIAAGPGRWLAFGGPDVAASLRARLHGLASVSDQSDGRAVLRVRGPHARAALAKGVPIDLHPRVFGPGSAAVTLVAHIGVVLWQEDATPSFCLAVPRSYAGSLADWLCASAAEFGLEVA